MSEYKQKITEADYIDAAAYLGVDVPVIKAVAEVESRGDGFLPDGQPVILFERHVFHKLTQGKFSKSHPDISNPRAGGYGKPGQHQHDKLARAVELDREAALQSASWGVFQVMGFNWQTLGYARLQDFINAAYRSESDHLDMFVRFIKANGLTSALKRHDWATFARKYNGPGYAKNQYDTKMQKAWIRHGGKT